MVSPPKNIVKDDQTARLFDPGMNPDVRHGCFQVSIASPNHEHECASQLGSRMMPMTTAFRRESYTEKFECIVTDTAEVIVS